MRICHEGKRFDGSIQAIWKAINASDIRTLYVRLYPTAEKLLELLEPSDEYMPLNSRHDRVFEFLRRYVRRLSKEKVPSFLKFVTGTSLALVPHITVAFTDLSGIQTRPFVHTCTSCVDVSTEYESFAAFCREFDTVICKKECFRYNSIWRVYTLLATLFIRDLKQTLEAARSTSTGSKISRSRANYHNHVEFCPRPPTVAAVTLFSDL